MKKVIFLFLIFLSLLAKGQKKESRWNDSIEPAVNLSAYLVARTDSNDKRAVLWTTSETGKLFYELRANFDAPGTVGLLFGKTFELKNKSFWITPKAGVLFGFNEKGFDGLSAEVNFGGKVCWSYYFSMSQFAISLNKNKPNFFFNYSTVGFQYWRLRFAYSGQVCYEFDNPHILIDQGPELTILMGKFSLQPWYTWDPGNKKIKKFSVGLAYEF